MREKVGIGRKVVVGRGVLLVVMVGVAGIEVLEVREDLMVLGIGEVLVAVIEEVQVVPVIEDLEMEIQEVEVILDREIIREVVGDIGEIMIRIEGVVRMVDQGIEVIVQEEETLMGEKESGKRMNVVKGLVQEMEVQEVGIEVREGVEIGEVREIEVREVVDLVEVQVMVIGEVVLGEMIVVVVVGVRGVVEIEVGVVEVLVIVGMRGIEVLEVEIEEILGEVVVGIVGKGNENYCWSVV